jgi:hypothetical protein
VILVIQVEQVLQEIPEQSDRQVMWVIQVLREQPVIRGLRVRQVILVIQVEQVLQEIPEQSDRQVM